MVKLDLAPVITNCENKLNAINAQIKAEISLHNNAQNDTPDDFELPDVKNLAKFAEQCREFNAFYHTDLVHRTSAIDRASVNQPIDSTNNYTKLRAESRQFSQCRQTGIEIVETFNNVSKP